MFLCWGAFDLLVYGMHTVYTYAWSFLGGGYKGAYLQNVNQQNAFGGDVVNVKAYECKDMYGNKREHDLKKMCSTQQQKGKLSNLRKWVGIEV